ncbi:hypothetical protein EGI16_03420 [Chryseobacterium sp. G0240]|uniref:hypothetical protein n=1 Tax=Chryseobacterium sp. G0240 TaxID=2487066 RepID=UPI000F45AC64|nr:hypothetical protein [Chryseobacterium sp. G0240]ROI05449.1 hypothetical protein EGI16_03420 [Chryseobacterium sp. G0240]
MSQICLENIVSVRDVCAEQVIISSSGYDLMDAPEIDIAKINDIANAEYNTGLKILKNCVRLALRDIETDFISVLFANKISAVNNSYDVVTGNFSTKYQNSGLGQKGIVIHKQGRSGIKKIRIKKIRIYPVNDNPNAQLKFIDSGKESVINIALTGGKVNEFATDYFVEGDNVKIVLEGVETYSSELTCLLGCGGTIPNDCGYVKGWNGSAETQKEGFGINAVFSCECDYSQILCQQSKNFVGLLVWLKARIYALEERINSTRINPFIIYGQEEAKNNRIELISEYNSKWNVFIDTIPNIIAGNDDCFECKKSKIVTNV